MPRRSYGENVAAHIARIVHERSIEDVLHFTRLENVATILEHGLQSVTKLKDATFDVHSTTAKWANRNDSAVSVSISDYNTEMFYAKRNRVVGVRWVILVLDPIILSNYHCRFFRRGASTSRSKSEYGKRDTGYALEKLFEDCSVTMGEPGTGFRVARGLEPGFPTFQDSEVEVMDTIHPGHIRGVLVQTPADNLVVKQALEKAGRDDIRRVVRPF